MGDMAHIMLVEDDSLMGKAVHTALGEAGYGVQWAKSGEEALDMLKAGGIDLVMLDIMLPGMDGYEVLKQIKANDQWSHLPVIMLSNLGQESEIDRAMQLGATDYIIKANIDIGKLIELTKKWVGQSATS
jgi:DNA-binding response OmpR family regulator